MADEPEGQEPGGTETLDDRVSQLETGQQSLTEKIDKLLGIVSGGGDKPDGEPPAPRQPSNIAEEIRAQLDERDRRDQAAADDKARGDRLAAVETKVAELAEKPPVTPPRRVEKLMGWR